MAYDVFAIANKLLLKAEDDTRLELLTNLKLQKMLYYEQGYHLAAFDTPLFDDEIEAWMYGPAVPAVYEHFKKFGRMGIEPESREPFIMTADEEQLFYNVFDTYADFSAYGLMRQTHREKPWLSARSKGPGNVISKQALRDFFITQMEDEKDS